MAKVDRLWKREIVLDLYEEEDERKSGAWYRRRFLEILREIRRERNKAGYFNNEMERLRAKKYWEGRCAGTKSRSY